MPLYGVISDRCDIKHHISFKQSTVAGGGILHHMSFAFGSDPTVINSSFLHFIVNKKYVPVSIIYFHS